jgi:hypothetical protein
MQFYRLSHFRTVTLLQSHISDYCSSSQEYIPKQEKKTQKQKVKKKRKRAQTLHILFLCTQCSRACLEETHNMICVHTNQRKPRYKLSTNNGKYPAANGCLEGLSFLFFSGGIFNLANTALQAYSKDIKKQFMKDNYNYKTKEHYFCLLAAKQTCNCLPSPLQLDQPSSNQNRS